MVLTMRKGSFSFPVLFILVMFLSFHIYGLGVKEIAEVHFGPWDFAFLLLLVPWVATVTVKRRTRLTKPFSGVMLLGFLFTLWVTASALFSLQPFRAFTMLMQQVRNILLFMMTGTLLADSIDMDRLNRSIFWAGVSISIMAISLYSYAWTNYSKILNTPSLWKPNVIYVLDQGGVLRLTGFARDPNFYSLWIAPALFAGLAMPLSSLKLLGLLVVGLSCILAMSRGFVLAFGASTIFLFIAVIVWRKKLCADAKYIKHIALTLIFMISATMLLQVFGLNLWDFFVKRIELAAQTPRFTMWSRLISSMQESWNPFLGMGLRGAQQTLEGMYSHNTYLDTLYETGLPGFMLWLSIIVYTTIIAMRRIRDAKWLPWVHTWLILLVMFGAFSLLYNPFPWLIMGVICASPLRRKRPISYGD